MTFYSILFEDQDGIVSDIENAAFPAFFEDLNISQIIEAVVRNYENYNLVPFFLVQLKSKADVAYRHQIFEDLENHRLFEKIVDFSRNVVRVREYLGKAESAYYRLQKQSWFLEAALMYCHAVNTLKDDLSSISIRSKGLNAFLELLISYTNNREFQHLSTEAVDIKHQLSSVRYLLLLQSDAVTVKAYSEEIDYNVEIENLFKRFQQNASVNHLVEFIDRDELNHIEAKILEYVSFLFPHIFDRLVDFSLQHDDFVNGTVARFHREIQFYISYIEFMKLFEEEGLKFCYPRLSTSKDGTYAYESFDLALANKLLGEDAQVVCNDFYLKGKERVAIVSGPNQGGKTTFARMFGQLHYFALLGCPVPGRKAQLYVFDNIFTHFEKRETVQNLHGKLEDDLKRIAEILACATSQSILILNELLSSTTLNDSIYLNTQIMKIILEKDLICLQVTFVDELTQLSEKIVSMVSTVHPDDRTKRTYKIVRKPADGLSFAMAIAQKYGLTYSNIKERLNINK